MNNSALDKYSFLIIGFGGMGCRHAQSLINAYKKSIIYVLEPNQSIFEKNLELIFQTSNKMIVKLSNLTDVKSKKIDFCVIATSSSPRYDILKSLFSYNISFFLVEKIVFQTIQQFESIKKVFGNKEIYVNFVSRYFQNYINIKRDINNCSFSMDIVGGDFGLTCNAIHYFDLFKYFGAKNINLDSHNLREKSHVNKRGSEYREFFGQISVNSKNGCKLNISSEKARKGDVEIIIKYSKKTNIINEGTLSHIKFFKNGIISEPFRIKFTSSLTSKIFSDILNSNCILPRLEDTIDVHKILFSSVNKSLKLNPADACPIT